MVKPVCVAVCQTQSVGKYSEYKFDYSHDGYHRCAWVEKLKLSDQ